MLQYGSGKDLWGLFAYRKLNVGQLQLLCCISNVNKYYAFTCTQNVINFIVTIYY